MSFLERLESFLIHWKIFCINYTYKFKVQTFLKFDPIFFWKKFYFSFIFSYDITKKQEYLWTQNIFLRMH